MENLNNDLILPPQNMEAEQSLLGAVFMDDSVIGRVIKAGLTPDMFYREANRLIYNEMSNLYNIDMPIDIILLDKKLQEVGLSEKTGGPAYLAEMVDAVGTAANVEHYAEIVKQTYFLRQVILTSERAKTSAYSYGAEFSEIWATFVNDMSIINPTEKTGETRQNKGVAAAVKIWVGGTEGTFTGQDCYNGIQTGAYGANDTYGGKGGKRTYIGQVLRRLVESGEIERSGKQDGVFRKIDNAMVEVDWKNADTEPFDIKWPFGIEKMAAIHPKSVVVIAGETNSGKTSYLLNTIKLNQNRGKEIVYLSSEFGGSEMRSRISNFEDIRIDDWNFKFYERSDNFADVIRPDAINIIDYLQVLEDFFLVGKKIDDIFQKLNTGIAIIALQKDPKKNQGIGGTFSLNLPRLYLNLMDNYPAGQLVQIKKAKNFVDRNKNPNNYEMGFTIYGGAVLTPNQSQWTIPASKRDAG